METTAATVEMEKLCNYVFHLSASEYGVEILGNDSHINRIMETDGKRTRIEMRKVDPDMSPDAKKIRAYEAKNNQNNDWSKKSAT